MNNTKTTNRFFKTTTVIRIITVIACIGISFYCSAQTKAKAKPVQETNINIAVYNQAISIGDATMAITAVHYLLASDFVKYTSWQDTLAVLYLQNNAYRQAYLLSNALISNRGYSDLRMEIKAIASKNLQQPAEAITAYSTLYSKTHNPAFGFEQLNMEFGSKKLTESIATGNALMKDISADTTLSVNVVKSDGKTSQQVSLKAAISNIMGLAYFDLKDKVQAQAQFEMAVKQTPDFEQAKHNLDFVKAGEAEPKK
jgi:tetratricopeptide (TPR) repeat protein